MRARPGVYLAVAAGSAIGGGLRALATFAALDLFGPAFPWGTLFVNVAGSFLIGFYAALAGPGAGRPTPEHRRQFVMAGLCGGFTTFSIFSLETVLLMGAGRPFVAGLYVGVSVATWLAAVWLGHRCARHFTEPMAG